MPHAPALAFDAHGQLLSELACIECGYNLYSLHREAACPECGTAVGRSIEGNRLRDCDPDWLKQIWEGLNCFGLAVVAAIVCVAVGLLGNGNPPFVALAVPLGLAICGFIKVTHPDPAAVDAEPWYSLRRLARGTWTGAVMPAVFILGVMRIGGWLAADDIETAIEIGGTVTLVMVLLGSTLLLAYAAALAKRLPNLPLVVGVALVTLSLIGVFGFGLILNYHSLWEALADPALLGWRAADDLRRHMMILMPYLTLGLAGLMMMLLGWYWWVVRQAARHARATWVCRGEDGR